MREQQKQSQQPASQFSVPLQLLSLPMAKGSNSLPILSHCPNEALTLVQGLSRQTLPWIEDACSFSGILFTGSLSKYLQQLGLGWSQSRGQEINTGLPYGWQESNYPSHSCSLQGSSFTEAGARTELGIKPSYFDMRHKCLSCQAKYLVLFFSFSNLFHSLMTVGNYTKFYCFHQHQWLEVVVNEAWDFYNRL